MENRAATRTFLCRKRFDTIQFDSIWPDSTLVNRWYKTLEWGILNVVSETIDSIAFRYPIWHMAFFFFLSFQRLEIKWKIDIQWDYWNLQGSGGRPFIWSRNKLKQIIVMFRYREWEINFVIWNILKMFESLSRNIYIYIVKRITYNWKCFSNDYLLYFNTLSEVKKKQWLGKRKQTEIKWTGIYTWIFMRQRRHFIKNSQL